MSKIISETGMCYGENMVAFEWEGGVQFGDLHRA